MMALPDEIISTVGPIVESVGADMSRRYRRYGLEQDDAAQQGWLWCFQHPAKLIEWFDDDNYSIEIASKMLARTLRHEVDNYGQDLKAQAVGYNRDDLLYYSKAQVRDLLPAMFDEESWLHPEQTGDGERRQKSVPAEGGNWIATLADISQAYAKLGKEDRDILAGFHRDGLTNQLMAEMWDLPKQTMSDRHDRAVKRLVDLLGGPRPAWPHDADCSHGFSGWVGRRSVSNAAARAAQDSYWDES